MEEILLQLYVIQNSGDRRSPLPQGGLEIPVTLMVAQGNTIFSKMKELVTEYYTWTRKYSDRNN